MLFLLILKAAVVWSNILELHCKGGDLSDILTCTWTRRAKFFAEILVGRLTWRRIFLLNFSICQQSSSHTPPALAQREVCVLPSFAAETSHVQKADQVNSVYLPSVSCWGK